MTDHKEKKKSKEKFVKARIDESDKTMFQIKSASVGGMSIVLVKLIKMFNDGKITI